MLGVIELGGRVGPSSLTQPTSLHRYRRDVSHLSLEYGACDLAADIPDLLQRQSQHTRRDAGMTARHRHLRAVARLQRRIRHRKVRHLHCSHMYMVCIVCRVVMMQ